MFIGSMDVSIDVKVHPSSAEWDKPFRCRRVVRMCRTHSSPSGGKLIREWHAILIDGNEILVKGCRIIYRHLQSVSLLDDWNLGALANTAMYD
jgi:hypothetical protein